jgi:biofilm PGA synthesis protein PgaA
MRRDYPMFASRAVRGVASFILISISIASHAQSRDEAVRKAREGKTEEAIVELRQIIASNPDDKEAAMDLAVVLTWAQRPREATDTFERSGVSEPPEFVLLAMARAYRDQQRFAEAQRLTREGLSRFPEAQSFALMDDLLAGDTALAAGDNFTALRAYAQALQLSGNDAGIAAVVRRILVDLNAPYAAAAYGPQPDLSIAADQAAEMVNWGADIVPPDPKKKFEQTDAAITKLDGLIQEALKQSPPERELVLRLKRDRVVALRNRERCTEAEEEVSAMRTAGDKLPSYVRTAEADCLLALRQPQEAARAYQDVLATDPADKAASQGLFYAYIEQENFNAAFAVADQALLEQAPVIRRAGSQRPIANWDWLDAELNSSLVRDYAGMSAKAWKRILPLAEGAPALAYLRSSQGSVAASLGWTRLADEEVHIALTLEPHDLGTQTAVAGSALRLNQFGYAEQQAAELSALFPQNSGVARLQRDVDAARAPLFRLETGGSSQSGNAVDAPGSGYAITARLYSSLLMDRWRVFAAYEYLREQPIEGVVRRIRYGVGADARWSDFSLEAIAWDNTGTLSRGGGTLAASWEANDHLSFSANAELYSIDTPLRATFYGITASGGGARTNYAWSDLMSISGGITALTFTDGNHRLQGTVFFQRRFLDRTRLSAIVQPELYLSRNTINNAPYFNPPHDATLGASVRVEQVLWRRYEHSLSQEVRGGASAYWQADFPVNWVGDVNYEQVLRFDPKWDLRYGGGVGRRVYDGRSVRNLVGSITLETRF